MPKRKVISAECEEAVNRLIAASNSMPEEMASIRPDVVRAILNDGGKKPWTITSVLASLYTNSLLMSTGMFIANAFSAASMFGFRLAGMSDRMASIAALTGKDAQLMTNMSRYFLSAMKTGVASDIGQDLEYVARLNKLTVEEVRKQAKIAYAKTWAHTDPNITEKEIEAFADAINLTDDEILRFVTDMEYMIGIKGVPDQLRLITLPQRGAIAIDEASKVLMRTLKVSELARKQAIKDAKEKGRTVDELHQQYFKEVMDVHNSRYQSEYKLAEDQIAIAEFRGVRGAVSALESKSNSVFQDLFPKEDIPYEHIREFAMAATFQRRLPDGPIGNAINAVNRLKQKTGKEFPLDERILAFGATTMFPFVKTPYNIAVEGYSYTPIALIPFLRPRILSKKRVIEGGKDTGKVKYVTEKMSLDEAATRTAIGLPILLGISTLFATQDEDGLPIITGTPLDEQERRRWQLVGIPERSVRINGVYVPFDRIEPLGKILTTFVDLHELVMRDRDWDDPEATPVIDMADELAQILYSSFFNAALLESGINFLDYFRYNKAIGVANFATDVVKGFIPTGVSDYAQIIDKEERLARDNWSKIKQRIPFVREGIPADKFQLEEGQQLSRNALEILLKMNFVPTNQTEVQTYIHRTKANIPKIDKKFYGVSLSEKELGLLRQITPKYLNKVLSAVVVSDTFLMNGAKRQKKMLEYNAARAMNPSFNKPLFAEFIKEGTKLFGPSWVKSLEARKFNQAVRDKGAQDFYDYMEVEEF